MSYIKMFGPKMFIIPLFLLIINLSNNPPQVNGDSTLIHNVCKKTPYPKQCQVCFDDNSGAVQMTLRELAGSAMYCTYNVSRRLQEAFVDLATKTTDAPVIKKVYQVCGSRLYNFAAKLAGAQTWWWHYNDDEAKKDFNHANGDYKSCQRSLERLIISNYNYNKVLSISQVVVQFMELKHLYLDSFAIILQSEKVGSNV